MIGIVPIFTKGRGRRVNACSPKWCERCVMPSAADRLRKSSCFVGGECGVEREPRGRGRDRVEHVHRRLHRVSGARGAAENVGRRRERVEHVRRRLDRVSGARGARR